MKSEELYELIYNIAAQAGLNGSDLDEFLLSADTINNIGTEDLHKLIYTLAEQGNLDEESLNNYLEIADRIVKNKSV